MIKTDKYFYIIFALIILSLLFAIYVNRTKEAFPIPRMEPTISEPVSPPLYLCDDNDIACKTKGD